jgi:hypothetical protein
MSKNEQSTHLVNIMSDLLDGKEMTANDVFASNSNQYFCTIKNNGIELIEVRKPNLNNKGSHLERRLNKTNENLDKAKSYLEKLKRLK